MVRDCTLLDALPMGVALVDQYFRIAHWNRMLVEWSEMAAHEMVGRDLRSALPGWEHERHRRPIESTLAGGPPAVVDTLAHEPWVRPSADHTAEASLRMTVSGWRDSPCGAPMALLVFENVTKSESRVADIRKQRDRARREIVHHQSINAELRQTVERLAATNEELEQFASMASHDLREPLHNIRMFADLLLEETEDLLPADGIDMVHRIGLAAERLERLLSESLALLRAGADVDLQQVVPLEDVVHAALGDLECRVKEAKAKVVIESLPAVLGDPVSIHHLLLNLLSNALKFRHPQRRAEVHVRAAQGSLSSGTGENPAVRLSVTDNGMGFDPGHASEIFKPFRRLNAPSASLEGHGLGLAICRRIVRSHHGQIWAESEVGTGTTLHVMLPAAVVQQPEIGSAMDDGARGAVDAIDTADAIDDIKDVTDIDAILAAIRV